MTATAHGDAAQMLDVEAGSTGVASNITGINGVAPSVGNGTTDTGTLRVTLSSDGTGKVAATQSGTWTVGFSASFVAPVTAATATATTSFLLGGQFNSTPQTFTNGQQGAINLTSRGAPTVALVDTAGAQLSTSNPVQTYRADSYVAITTNATTVVKSGAGVLSHFVISAIGTTETVAIYDALSATGTPIFNGILTGLVVGTSIRFDCAVATGITVVTSGAGAATITVFYR